MQCLARVPKGRSWLISSGAKEWADDIAFNLPPPHQLDRTSGLDEAALWEILTSDANAVALVRESEYVRFALARDQQDLRLAAADSQLKILASGETYGHGGLTLKMLKGLRRERLFVVGH